MQLAAGVLLAQRYRLERKLGAGGMGEVWAAKNTTVGTDVAVKILLAAAAVNAEIVMRFRREAFLLARVRNDHVARVLDFASDDTYGLVLVMDLVDGAPLSQVLGVRRLSVEEAIDLGIDVLRGVSDLHRANIVHRDLKPGNVILERRSEGPPRAVIVDFGLGRLMVGEEDDHDTSGITRADMAVGTVEYMAPEQIINSRRVGAGADIYSLGAMLYRAVSGVHLFGDLQGTALAQTKLLTPPPQLVTGRVDPVAKGFEAVVARAIARRPEDRYARADDMLSELKQVLRRAQALAIDDETTTLQDQPSPLKGTPPPPSPQAHAPPPHGAAQQPAAPQPHAYPVPGPEPQPPARPAPPRSPWGAVAAVLLALILGAGAGAVVMQKRLTGRWPVPTRAPPP